MKKDMINPEDWGIEEIKEATTVIALCVPCFLVFYIVMWIFY